MQKDWLSFDEQLELLAGRGMCIEDECTAVQVLSCVSYYRLSGYFRYWQKDPEYGDNNFIPGTSFSRIYQLYVAERALPLRVKIYWPRVKSSYEHGSLTTTEHVSVPLELLLGALASRLRHPRKSLVSMTGFCPTLAAVQMLLLRTTATQTKKVRCIYPRPMTGCRYGSQWRY